MEFKLKRFETPIVVTRLANVQYFEFTPEYHTKNDRHAFRELLYVDSGEIVVQGEHYRGTLRKGQMILHRSMELHALRCDAAAAPNVVIIGFTCENERLDFLADAPTVLTDAQVHLLTDVVREGRTVFLPPYDVPNMRDMKKQKNYPFGADQMIKILLESLLISILREHGRERSKLRSHSGGKADEIRDYLETHFTEEISLDELCFLFHTNKTTLCSRFREVHGCTLVEYLTRFRLNEAKKLLREQSISVSEAAFRSGFRSLHYFCRVFRMRTGMSPGEYRRTIKAKFDVPSEK